MKLVLASSAAAVSALAAVGLTPPAAVATAAPAPLLGASAPGAIPGRYVVVLKDAAGLRAAGVKGGSGTSAAALDGAVERGRRLGATVRRTYRHAVRGYAAELGAGPLAAVRADPAVAYVQASQRYHATGTQRDADWGLDRIDQRRLPRSGSYYYTGTGNGVTAYVVDTGILAQHPDFTTDVRGNPVSSRAAGGVSTVATGTTTDCNGHGTHVSGTIGGTVYGVAKEVSLVPVRVLDCDGGSDSETVAAGLDWIVADHATGPAVANLSLTNDGGTDTVVESAVRRTIADGVTVVIAAGNGDEQGNGVSACSVSPSDVRAAITVGATTRTDKRSTFSNYGSCVDLYAPGSDIVSDWISDGDGNFQVATESGTSMATPHVTGAVALYLEKHPTATPAQVQAAIVAAATPATVTGVSSKWPRRLLFSLQPRTPPAATGAAGAITTGTALRHGQTICSANSLYCLTQLAAGLVLRKPGERTLWATGRAAAWTTLNGDGNLASYDTYGRPTWSAGARGGPGTLKVTDEGNLTIVTAGSGQVTWTSNRAQRTAPAQTQDLAATLEPGLALYRGGARLRSPNGGYQLILRRSTGDLVLWKTGTGTVWHTGARDDDWLTVTADGELVLRRADGRTVWTSGTADQGAARLVLRDSGDLALVRLSDDRTLWRGRTAGA